jgi:hypothetical protein
MPVDMRKLILIALIAIIMIALAVGVYTFLERSSADQAPAEDAHFTIRGISGLEYFNGESVIVRAVAINDGPEKNVSVSNATAAPPVSSTDRYTVIAELKGDQSSPVVRTTNVLLANNVATAIVFDFGRVPVGSYIVTVMVPGYNSSKTSASVAVKPTPLMNEWTSIGDVAFLFDNLWHDSIDVNIRNNGQHTVMFGDRHYIIFVNSSDDYGVLLQGLNETLVWPGKTVTVRAEIPHAGSYYLDHFAITVPGRAGPVKFPWGVWMTAV